ncbi:AAA family ATPase [Shewanella sp. GXUN23E]|uniref:AAA family ATPase n=1 Tax=Shewanella sp. GXUN23E TaxID=3422498 RepID=UPI003D7DE617
MTNQTPMVMLNRKDKIKRLMAEMSKGLFEREDQIKLLMLAALAGEHVLLIGPPGTAKSELAKRLKSVFVEANYFERLLTRFSVPEELFGPLSIQALEQDQYKRLTSGYLPEASVAFIDEIFKANSAILNSLLTLLNEREFDNGNRRVSVPLISVVAASNELPEGEELNALYDRFMLRSFVHPVSDDSFTKLLNLTGEVCDPELNIRLKLEDLKEIQQLAGKVALSPSVEELCSDFRRYLAQENIVVSDRRWRKVVKLMKVSAFTSGQTQVTNYDAWILPHCLWNKPEQFEALEEIYQKSAAIKGDFNLVSFSKVLAIWEEKLKRDKAEQRQKYDERGRPLYLDEKGKETTNQKGKVHKQNSEGELLYKDSYNGNVTTNRKTRSYDSQQNSPIFEDVEFEKVMELFRHSDSHIKGRLDEVGKLKSQIQIQIEALQEQLSSAESVFSSHLWLDEAMLPTITASLESALTHTQELLKRVNKVIKGFEALPREQPLSLSDAFEQDSVNEDEEEAIEGELCD